MVAEVIYHRVDAEKEFMGLMSFSGEDPTLKEAKIAKVRRKWFNITYTSYDQN